MSLVLRLCDVVERVVRLGCPGGLGGWYLVLLLVLVGVGSVSAPVCTTWVSLVWVLVLVLVLICIVCSQMCIVCGFGWTSCVLHRSSVLAGPLQFA
jgi:hypothetical protein